MSKTLTIVLFYILVPVMFSCGNSPQDRTELLILKNAVLIDGTGNPPVENSIIVIEKEKIIEVTTPDKYEIPDGAKVIDLTGKYIMPGLIDMHAHVTFLINNVSDEFNYDRNVSEKILKDLLRYGITTVRNPGAPTKDGIKLRDDVNANILNGPRIFTAGNILNSNTFGMPVLYRVMKSRQDVIDEIQTQREYNVDFIKIYSGLTPSLTDIAIREAHKHDLKVIGHLGRTSWLEASDMGIDNITHGCEWNIENLPGNMRTQYENGVSKISGMKSRILWMELFDPNATELNQTIESLKQNNVSIDPTLIAYKTKFWGNDDFYTANPLLAEIPELADQWRKFNFVKDWSEKDFSEAQKYWIKILQFIKRLYDSGVTLTAGSDLPNPWVIPGVSLHWELELLSESGIPALEVIKIATYNGAMDLGILNEVGTIEKGKIADLVVLNSDPLRDIKNTKDIFRVFQSGKIVNE